MQEKINRIIREMRRHVGGKSIVSHSDPFRVLIATVISQRTRDENTKKVAAKLFSRHATPEAIALAPLKELEGLVKESGFYRVKASRIKRIAEQIAENFNGAVPDRKEDLLRLEGVGPKTAACVQVYGFDSDDLPVDVHVFRISNRLGLVNTKTPEETEAELKRKIPRRYWKEINLLMVRYGQKVCLPRNPRCDICALADTCRYFSSKQGNKKREKVKQ